MTMETKAVPVSGCTTEMLQAGLNVLWDGLPSTSPTGVPTSELSEDQRDILILMAVYVAMVKAAP